MSTSQPTGRPASHRQLRLLAGAAAALVIEIFLYRTYLDGDGSFHWFTHFFAGTSLALVVMTLVTLRCRKPVPLPLLWLLLGHLLAMGPDLLFVHEVAHQPWMDVFVAHNASHFISGRNVTWYLIFLACLAAYLLVLPGRSRLDQAAAGTGVPVTAPVGLLTAGQRAP